MLHLVLKHLVYIISFDLYYDACPLTLMEPIIINIFHRNNETGDIGGWGKGSGSELDGRVEKAWECIICSSGGPESFQRSCVLSVEEGWPPYAMAAVGSGGWILHGGLIGSPLPLSLRPSPRPR